MASKRKILTLDERIKVIELCKTKSARKVAEELGVGKTQIMLFLLMNASSQPFDALNSGLFKSFANFNAFSFLLIKVQKH
jgi:uncharacterized membrane protein YkgB